MPGAESHPRRRRRHPPQPERLIRTRRRLEAERLLVPEFSPVRFPRSYSHSSNHNSRNSNRSSSRINNGASNRRNSNNFPDFRSGFDSLG